jgi:Protein of unknown function (DUF2497)
MPKNPLARSLPERFAESPRLLAADEPAPQPPGGGRSSVADLVRDLLRPMIQRWLDENLQALVERIIRTEVSDVMRRTAETDLASFAETVVRLVRRENER